jgi:hypothetical protein
MINKSKKAIPKTLSLKKEKYDITVKTDLSPDELFKKAINTPIKNSKSKKK